MVAMDEEGLRRIVEGNVVVILGRRGCCMSYVTQRLLQGLKANPTMCEVSEGFAVKMRLRHKIGKILHGDDNTSVALLFQAVVIRGKLVGGFDQLIHISNELLPILKISGAL
ncbi:Glutaredoxin and related proteins protein [Dioscorea alata]|uniref:Glutaredoxin and related proteins protein n=1 Tax=Dioscorea alata TaxID=55571 RepID=A0ACB7UKZ6_DIOAL|nr:Glutaredoxin and related proteins protein [Dioscorea alata]